jgi:predicted RNase H-like nuclease
MCLIPDLFSRLVLKLERIAVVYPEVVVMKISEERNKQKKKKKGGIRFMGKETKLKPTDLIMLSVSPSHQHPLSI